MKRIDEYNLSGLSEKELDFHNFAILNMDIILHKSIPEIAKLYGVGVSFIYDFFKKMGFSNSREFVFYLGSVKTHKEDINEGINSKIENSLIYEALQESNIRNAFLLHKQKNKISELIKDIYYSSKVYCTGLGSSKMAIIDLIETLDIWNKKVMFLEEDKNKIDENVKSVIIFFSMRGFSRRITSVINDIKNFKNTSIYIITSNEKPVKIEFMKEIIVIDNIMKRVDNLNNDIVISPITSFIYFNNVLKSIWYSLYKKELINNKQFSLENEAWIDDAIARELTY